MSEIRSKDEQISILSGTVATLATGAYNGTMDAPAILALLGLEGEPGTLTDDHVYAALKRLGCGPETIDVDGSKPSANTAISSAND